MEFSLETAKDDFIRFWDLIGARGNLDAALASGTPLQRLRSDSPLVANSGTYSETGPHAAALRVAVACKSRGWGSSPKGSQSFSGRATVNPSRAHGYPRQQMAPPEQVSTTMRVAMLAPISWRVPPRHYGPWEQFVSLLTEGLVRRGVDVTLFATADSVTGARLVGTAPTGYSEDDGLDPKVWEGLHISAVFERAGEFDVIHNSFDFLPLTYSGSGRHPGCHHHPRVLVRANRAGLREVQRPRLLRGDQRRRPARPARLRRHDPPRHRHASV